jgi:hypothetical protein
MMQAGAVAKFLCSCGETVRTSGSIPNPAEWRLIADEDFDIDLDASTLLGNAILAWRCEACGRLWLEDGRIRDARSDRLWEYLPAFSDEPGPLGRDRS